MHNKDIEESRASVDEGRRGGMVPVGQLLARATPDHGVDWAILVGAGLAETTLPLGVNDAGVLRIMAAHETALKEIEARRGGILDVWNLAATEKGASRARDLQCWVRPGLVIPARASVVRTATKKTQIRVSKRERELAMQTTAHLQDGGVKEALTDMRARALAADKRKRMKGDD